MDHNPGQQDNTDVRVDDYDDDPLSKLRGGKDDTCIQPVHPEINIDQVVNIAQGENQSPICIPMDKNFQEVAFPHLLPHRQFGWKHERLTPQTAKKYF